MRRLLPAAKTTGQLRYTALAWWLWKAPSCCCWAECGIGLHLSSLRCWLRRSGYRWKRRRSLRPQRDPAAFAAGQQHLRALHTAEARGEAAVVYVDECRFSRQAPVPDAWQVHGQPPVALPAVRGSGGHSVRGFWQAGVAGQPLTAYRRAGALTADLFVLAVDQLSQTLTAQLRRQLHGHLNSVLSLCALSPTLLLSDSRDTTIKVWEQRLGALELVRTLAIHAATVLAVARLTDSLFASSSADKTIKVSVINGGVQHTLVSHTDWVGQVVALPHGQLVSSSEDGTLWVWDWQRGLNLGIIASGQPPIHSLLFEPAQRLLISGDYAGRIEVRQASPDYTHWTVQQRFAAHQGIVRTLAWLGNDRLASGGEDNKVNIWQLSTGQCEQEMLHRDFVQDLAWSPASC